MDICKYVIMMINYYIFDSFLFHTIFAKPFNDLERLLIQLIYSIKFFIISLMKDKRDKERQIDKYKK